MSDPKPRLPLIGPLPLGRRPRLRIVGPATEPASRPPVDAQTSGVRWARQYQAKLRLTDVGIIVVAVSVALLARFGVEGAQASIGGFQADYWAVAILIAATWVATLGAFHTRDSRVVGIGASEYKQVANASALAFGLLAIGFLVFQVDIARGFFILALPLGVVGLLLERWLWRKWLLHQRHFGHYLARAIVVGNREDVEYVVNQIDEKSGAAYYVVGAALQEGTGDSVNAGDHEVPVVADFDHVADAAAAMGVDTVIVAGQPKGGSQYIRTLGWELEGTSAELVLSSRLTDVAGPRIHFRPVEGLPLIHVEIPHFEGAKHVLKRTLDVGAAFVGLLLLLPLLVVIGILIRIDGPGPILFRQERCGRNQRTFQMLKYRSMVETAEDDLAGLLDKNEASGVMFKIRNDPRITRVGRVLRKYSLDELPQLWNVLIGDMSLVGPRPPLPREVDGYEVHVHRRLYIKPGLTGMWQVNGRSDLSWEESVRLDLYYVENWSLTGDLMILWRTLRVLTHPTGAY
ncbi:sugar transferase [Cryobacterium tagatosivorans]|uniref:Sugar transferase n=1 Tax=Cryobacterium tagatosivorans TaxID=1259199 RepID=A0A4R8UE76_9MICO|nr:sugar transferase [Cryobacterium tagatosivorans]TFB51730.1 sugar transferase [Cryobacterium tagatosivorans]